MIADPAENMAILCEDALLPVAVGSGCVATVVPISHGVCGGGEDACGKSWSALVPFVQALDGWSFSTVTLCRQKAAVSSGLKTLQCVKELTDIL